MVSDFRCSRLNQSIDRWLRTVAIPTGSPGQGDARVLCWSNELLLPEFRRNGNSWDSATGKSGKFEWDLNGISPGKIRRFQIF